MGNWVARPDQLLSLDSPRLFSPTFLSRGWLVGWLFLACEGVLASVSQSSVPARVVSEVASLVSW